jgi:ribosomal protein S18 acetylase RimI-like enzyme
VNGVRALDEILVGHQAQGRYAPDQWWLARLSDRPVGVLLTTAWMDGPGWDIPYLGLVPGARGRGLGKELVLKALLEARAAEAGQLTLAVDARNGPARGLYQGMGFEEFDRREVFLAIWRPPSEGTVGPGRS